MPPIRVRDLAEHHFARLDQIKQQRNPWEFDWQDQVELLLPGAQDIILRRTPGESRTDRLFDNTGMMSLQTLAANLQGAVTNQAIQWARYRFRDQALNQQSEVAAWLNVADELQMASYAASNFYQATHTYYLHLGGFGTAAMYVGSRQVGRGDAPVQLRFRVLQPGSYGIAENGDGIVDTLYWEFERTPRQAYQLWGDNLSAKLTELLLSAKDIDKPQWFVQAVVPRADYAQRTGRMDNRAMPFASYVFEKESRHLVEESGFDEFPFLVSRWETMDNAPWGFGPGHLCLPDVRTLNKLKEMNLLMLVLMVQPPLKMLREAAVGGVSLEPLALNVLTQMDALDVLQIQGNPSQVKIEEADLKASIKDVFFVDALQALPPVEASKMTAFEVSQRIELMQRLMGPAFSRLLSEMLDPLADRVFGLLLRGGVIPQIPREVLEAASRNAGQLDVEYEGPLARAQRGADVRAIGEVYAIGNQMAAATQDLSIWDILDHDEVIRHAAQVAGLPRHLMRDAVKVMRMRQKREAVQAQLQMAEELRQDATAIGRVAPVMEQMQEMQAA